MKPFLLFYLLLVNLLSWTLSQCTICISYWFLHLGQFDTCVWGEINSSKISDKLLEAIFIWGVDMEYKYAAQFKKKNSNSSLALRIHVPSVLLNFYFVNSPWSTVILSHFEALYCCWDLSTLWICICLSFREQTVSFGLYQPGKLHIY